MLYSGSLTKRKGVDLLAQAFAELVHQAPQDLRLEVIGDGPLRGFMEDALADVRDQVHFHGFQSWEALPGLYARGDILCAPSRYDGWGMIIPEGLAAGLPVTATDRMGAAIDLITPGRNGWIAEADNLDSLVETISQAREAYSKRPMAKSARASVASHQLEDGVERFLVACKKTIAQW
jgi:glycosyltransferase involved in cell wall biosynthesis